jgi:pimeloyl-ACP methyl ester carboxylesterase
MVAGKHLFYSMAPTGYLTLSDGYTAEYVVRGEGEPIVLIPGLAGGIGLLRPLMDALATSHRVIALELRGEKNCLCERSFHFDRLVKDVSESMDLLRLESPGLVGVSFGGAIALDLATRLPHRVGYLAIQGANAHYERRLFDGVARKVLDRLLLPGDNPFVNQFFRILTGRRSMEGFGVDFVISQCWSTDQAVMAHRFALLEEYDVSHRLERLRMPVLMLAGEMDVVVPPSDAITMESLVPRMETRSIPEAGHFAFVTHARLLADEIRDFRRSVLAPAL